MGQFHIAVLGTLDTKGHEHQFVADCIRGHGLTPILIDVGSQGPPTVQPDIERSMISSHPIPNDRGKAIDHMGAAAARFLTSLVTEGKIQGVISLGGTGGTSIGTRAMRALPLGFPKVMVSTVAGGNVEPYVGTSDIVMIPSIVDVSGLNRISTGVFRRAAAAVCAMVSAQQDAADHTTDGSSKPVVVASMFGNTTQCIEYAKKILEDAGYEVIVFHATGAGGRAMESLIASGMVSGVLDITITEWADELVGGVMPGGASRLESAARNGIPAVIAPGCLDMVNFRNPESVPTAFSGRRFYQHNPQVTLMRTTPEECAQLGRIVATKLNLSVGPVHVVFPLRAISVISAPGGPFHDPVADEALRSNLQSTLRSDIPFETMDLEINDPSFADRCARILLQLIADQKRAGTQSTRMVS